MANNTESGFRRNTILELLNLGIESANAKAGTEPPLAKPEELEQYVKAREAHDKDSPKA